MPRRHTPTKHTPFQSLAQCGRKRQFKTEAEALKAIESSQLSDMSLQLVTYNCPYCSKWHLSSASNDRLNQ